MSQQTLALGQLFEQLEYHRPTAVLLASKDPDPTITDYLHQHSIQYTHLTPPTGDTSLTKEPKLPQRAFAIVIDYLEHLEKSLALQQLALWRNCHCNHIWLAVAANCSQWQFQDFIALGFQRLSAVTLPTDDGDRRLNTYGYDLGHYNRKRNWNNSRYWANPEQWNKR